MSTVVNLQEEVLLHICILVILPRLNRAFAGMTKLVEGAYNIRRMYKFIIKYKFIFLLTLIYFFFRFVNLTLIPIFNDESIYLDWGRRELHTPGLLFYSLYDAKPPLLMWIFGLSSMIFTNPLFAGRLVSVITGYVTLIGLWKLTNRYSSKSVAFFSCLLYIFIPLFSFFDRQALMESAIGATGIYLFLFTLDYLQSKKIIWAVAIGIVSGIGYSIKSTALIFFFCSLAFIILEMGFRRKQWKDVVLSIAGVCIPWVIIIYPMISQSEFWETLASNSRYTFTVQELVHFPLQHWMKNLIQIIEIMIVHLTPFPVLLLVGSMIYLILKRPPFSRALIVWFFVTMGAVTLFTRGIVERYVVSFLPLSVVFISIGLEKLPFVIWRKFLIFFCILTTLSITLLQLFSPVNYFSFLQSISQFSLQEYTTGYTSGYGIPEVITFLKHVIGSNPSYVVMAQHTGNPESAIISYFANNSLVKVGYMDSAGIAGIETIDCLTADIPVFFVSRERDQAGLDRFFIEEYFQKNPLSNFGIGVYTLKKECHGKTLNLSESKN